MTNMAIQPVLQASSLSDESKLNALTLFALVRPSLNCNFASFLRYLEGPARADLVGFMQATTAAKLPVPVQVVLLANYLETQEMGAQFTLQQYVDTLMNQLVRQDERKQEEAFVQRVVESQPAAAATVPAMGVTHAPAPAPAPSNNGWGMYANLSPGPQAPVAMNVPQSQLPIGTAVSGNMAPAAQPTHQAAPFDGGVVPMEDFAPDDAMMAAEREAILRGGNPAPAGQAGWDAVMANATNPQPEADIPQADPLPGWFRAGGRAEYELGDQKLLVTIRSVNGRHAEIVAEDGQTWHNVAVAFLTESQAPYELRATIPASTMKDLAERIKRPPVDPKLPKHSCLGNVVDFTQVSPLDGTKLHLMLELVTGEQPGQLCYALWVRDNALNDMQHVIKDQLEPNWSVNLLSTAYHLHLTFETPAAEPEEEPVAETTEAAPKKKAAPKKAATKKSTKGTK